MSGLGLRLRNRDGVPVPEFGFNDLQTKNGDSVPVLPFSPYALGAER
jgi:hypothetical protein